MAPRIARLYALISVSARVQLLATVAFLIFERLFLAAGAIGFARGSSLAWAATALLVTLWGVRGLLRQNVSVEVRRKLTTMIAETALANGDGSFLPGSDAHAAVFEGRYVAEQILLRHAPSLFAETAAGLILLLIIRPGGVPVVVSVATIATTALLLAWFQGPTARLQKSAWRQYMAVADRTLTSIRAASEIVASGHDRTFLERLRVSVDDWIRIAARAERRAALFQRLPFTAVLLLAAGVLAQAPSLEFDGVLRLAVLLPPLAGLTRSTLEFVRSGPKLAILEPCFAARRSTAPRGGQQSANGGPAEIRFDRVSFAFGETPVLRDLSFVWKPGGAIGIRGPNGSGKSTLLKLALGLLQPDAGSISIGGVDVRQLDLPAWRRTITYLPQRPYVPEGFSVYETMQLTLPALTESEARDALALTGAWDHLVRCSVGKVEPLEVAMSQLSVGVRQRVLLARAFAQPADLTLLDEPDENLDHHARTVLIDLVKRLGATRMIVIATHDATMLATTSTILDLTPRAMS